MTRALCLLAVALSGALTFATSASADPPIREPILIEDFVLEGSCDFPVLLEVIANKQHITVFPDGRLHFTGKLFVRATNLSNDESLVLNISGPGFITPTSERGAGRGLFLLREGEALGPGLLLVAGRADIVRAESGLISGIEIRGKTTDICAVLA